MARSTGSTEEGALTLSGGDNQVLTQASGLVLGRGRTAFQAEAREVQRQMGFHAEGHMSLRNSLESITLKIGFHDSETTGTVEAFGIFQHWPNQWRLSHLTTCYTHIPTHTYTNTHPHIHQLEYASPSVDPYFSASKRLIY